MACREAEALILQLLPGLPTRPAGTIDQLRGTLTAASGVPLIEKTTGLRLLDVFAGR